jgi:hypothetical protein
MRTSENTTLGPGPTGTGTPGVELIAGYYEEDTFSIRAGDAWRLGPGLWAPKRASEDAQSPPGPEGILANVRARAPLKWWACSLNTHREPLAQRTGAEREKGRAQDEIEARPRAFNDSPRGRAGKSVGNASPARKAS